MKNTIQTVYNTIMSIEIIGEFIELVGKIMIAFTAIMVHRRVWKEHQIDIRVYKEMKREQLVGVIGIALMITGFVLKTSIHF